MGSALTAIDRLIESFGRHDRDAYFDCFATDATFLFHNSPVRLESREEYETLWREWEELGDFKVLSCVSTKRRIQILGDTAIFSHDVRTEVSMGGQRNTIGERESIIMHCANNRWLCVHEHLSVAGEL